MTNEEISSLTCFEFYIKHTFFFLQLPSTNMSGQIFSYMQEVKDQTTGNVWFVTKSPLKPCTLEVDSCPESVSIYPTSGHLSQAGALFTRNSRLQDLENMHKCLAPSRCYKGVTDSKPAIFLHTKDCNKSILSASFRSLCLLKQFLRLHIFRKSSSLQDERSLSRPIISGATGTASPSHQTPITCICYRYLFTTNQIEYHLNHCLNLSISSASQFFTVDCISNS